MQGIVDGIRLTEEPLGMMDAHGYQYSKGFCEGREIARKLGLPERPIGASRELVDAGHIREGGSGHA